MVLPRSTIDAPRSLQRTLAAFRNGIPDPTTRLEPGRFLHATLTPDGPGTLRLTWQRDPAPPAEAGLDAAAWGPGATWLLDRVDRFTGTGDHAVAFEGAHPAVERALCLTRHTRVGASGGLYHQLLPTILAQRITAGEAIRQWERLVRALGEPAPGPPDVTDGLRLPPMPDHLHRRPAWWFHPLGIETKRARALGEVARHADRLWPWAEAGPSVAGERLALLPGVGPWTIGSVLGPSLGDPDAVPVGDYHFPNTVAWALAGEPRADDDRMLELLAPYAGQRGRVLRALVRVAGPAPAFGPRRRVLPMHRW
ncbi:MAG: DNA-3-methyladenine glycosylase family protein [Acidimicrobiia bacterium]